MHASSVNGDVAPSPVLDLFEQGFDSLNATFLRNRLIGALRNAKSPAAQATASKISQNFVFEYPTIRQIATTVAALIDPSSASPDAVFKGPADRIRDFIEKYSAGLATRAVTPQLASQRNIAVFLTGSTGNVGSHILVRLLQDERVTRIYTFDLVFKEPVTQIQHAAFEDRGLPSALLSNKKLCSLVGDLNAPFFGLSEEKFNEVN